MPRVNGVEMRRARVRAGLSIRQLAHMCGSTYAHIDNGEHGRKPIGRDLLYRIAEILEITPEQLVADKTAFQDAPEPMTLAERNRLTELEATILRSPAKLERCMEEIRELRLFRGQYLTFDAYLEHRWETLPQAAAPVRRAS